ncbi:MAG: hypothetical protein JWM96_982 [Alphaproteobacteria bacterium]|nr:hypothetical protein [Alphaproteobacteria bacterium]
MDVTPLIRRDAKIIQSYRGGVFKVSGEAFTTSIIVMAEHVLEWPDQSNFEILRPFSGEVDVLLLGTGEKLVMPSPAVKRQVKDEFGIILEAMDNGAASRTYNVLLAEGRKVAAALTLT